MDGQVREAIGKEASLNPIQAEIEAIAVGRRSKRISAGLLLALGVLFHSRNKLTGSEWKILQLIDDEFEMKTLRRLRNALFSR